MDPWTTDRSEILRGGLGTTDDAGEPRASKQAGRYPYEFSDLVLCAGRAVERRGWPTAHLIRVGSLAGEGPSGDPLVVVETAAAMSAAIAQGLAALAGAGREVMLVTDMDPPSEVSSWLPSSAVVTLDNFTSTSAEQHESSASASHVGPELGTLTGETDVSGGIIEQLENNDALHWIEDIEDQVGNGAQIPQTLDHLTISVCTERAWFTPLGAAYSPRPPSDFPSGSQGTYYELCANALGRMGALLSIPIRVDGVVGLGLLFPGEDLGFYSRGKYLSGSSTRTPPRQFEEDPGYEDNSALPVEVLANPYGDGPGEGDSALSPLPPVVTAVPFGQELVEIFVAMFMQSLGRILLQEGAVGLRRVDYPGSLNSAWEATMSQLRDLGNR